MKVLLLGGTGAMGAYLAEILAKRGDDVFVTSRSDRKASQGITYIKGNAHNVEFLKGVISEHYDVIVDFMAYNTVEFK
ncbi:MAG: NAD-dependent epimerase/dehydratase family protein [Ruminococcus sp.]|nr:NAD-dependent epimerase/dehydratase family protein [Ruminococcus sp.]